MRTKDGKIQITKRPIASSFRKQLFAMFFAGVAVNQTITHWALGTAQLPITTSFYILTPQLNLFASIFWPIVAVSLLIYSCFSFPKNMGQDF